MNEFDDLDLLERQCGPALRVALRRVAAEISVDTSAWQPGPTVRFLNGEHAALDEREAHTTSTDDLPRERYPRRRWMLVAAATIVVLGLGLLALAAVQDPDSVQTDTVPPTPAPSTDPATTTALLPVDSSPATLAPTTAPAPGAVGESAFAMTSPSVDEEGQATDGDLYRDGVGTTQVSAAGNSVSLRRCRPGAVSTCGTGWAYVTGVADGGEVHGGLLGEAGDLDLHLLDDRYFVASESSPDAQAPSTAWLIDSVSGRAGALSWRDEPTTLNSPEQSLLLCQDSYITKCATARSPDPVQHQFVEHVASGGTVVTVPYVQDVYLDVPTEGGLPRVVDARDGTIRPLAMPDDVVPGLPVAQHGTGRIWVGTDPDGDGLGLAYSDDGGATWSEVALPAINDVGYRETLASGELLEIAADGDRVAVALSWGADTVYVSDDAGRSWTTATPSEPAGNGAHLYVLADGRLVLMWSIDVQPKQVLVSTRSWAELENVDVQLSDQSPRNEDKKFSVNRAGIALIPSSFSPCVNSAPCYEGDEVYVLDTIDFSGDLTNWSTIEILDDDR